MIESLARGSEYPLGSYPGGDAFGGDDGGREEMREMLRVFGALTYDLVIYMRQHGNL